MLRYRLFSVGETLYTNNEVEAASFSGALLGFSMFLMKGSIEPQNEIICVDTGERKTVEDILFEDTTGVFDYQFVEE